ncbi:hypothetical protein QEN19_003960 [Hanseniaspora menglaensis]
MSQSTLHIPKTRQSNQEQNMGNIFSLNTETVQQPLWQRIIYYFIPYEQTIEYSRTSSPSSSRSNSRISSQGINQVYSHEDTLKSKRKYDSLEKINVRKPNKARKIDFNEVNDELRVKIKSNNLQSASLKKSNPFNFSNISIKNPEQNKRSYSAGIKLSKYNNNKVKNVTHRTQDNDLWKSLSLLHQNQSEKVSSLKKDLSHLDKDPLNNKKFSKIRETYNSLVSTANEKTNSNNNDEKDDDVIFISERKIPVYEKLNKKYNDRLVFDKKYFELVYQKYLDVCKEQKKERDTILTSKLVSKDSLLPMLSENQLTKIRKEFNKNTRQSIRLSNRFKLDIYNTDFATLKPGQWLNSNVIEYFLKTLEMEDEKLVAFSPFFITKLSSDGYNSVKRWMKMKKRSIMNIEKMFVPINLNQNHWVCAMVDFKNKRILYLDSMCNDNSRSSFIYLERIKDYVVKESENKIGQDFELVHLPCPQQQNGYDCGIFILMNALQLAKDTPFILTQKDASEFRYHVGNQILEHGL